MTEEFKIIQTDCEYNFTDKHGDDDKRDGWDHLEAHLNDGWKIFRMDMYENGPVYFISREKAPSLTTRQF